MTRYAMHLIVEKWIKPHCNISRWEYFDLSCASRDSTDDQVLRDAVNAGKRLGAIFKEPTITPTAMQVKEMKLKRAWGSPNGAMRRGWNGISISRDTIHIEGVKLGFERPVLFDRHAVGGEYHAGWKSVHAGRLVTQFFPADGSAPVLCDDRTLLDKHNVVVTYHNPLDNVHDLAHHFFTRCLKEEITPYVVTKKTVFKWQEGFWKIMQSVYDNHYKEKFVNIGVNTNGELHHLISDAATMQIIRWTKGGFGMCAHNYDGDMLTDEIAQVHRSPGFLTSNLVGKSEDGRMIKEFEASHGTVSDLWHAHLRGEETSLNPLGMAEALLSAMEHSANLTGGPVVDQMQDFTQSLRKAMHHTFRCGEGTRDIAGPSGLTTEEFIDRVAWRMTAKTVDYDRNGNSGEVVTPTSRHYGVEIDHNTLRDLFDSHDPNGTGTIGLDALEAILAKLNVAPQTSSKLKRTEEQRTAKAGDELTEA